MTSTPRKSTAAEARALAHDIAMMAAVDAAPVGSALSDDEEDLSCNVCGAYHHPLGTPHVENGG